MSVTITVNKSMIIADKEIDDLPKNLSQEDHDVAVCKILYRNEITLCNGSFIEIFEMLGYEIDTINFMIGQVQIDDVPSDYEGDIEGVELETLKERIKNLLVIIEKNPKQFTTMSIRKQYLGGVTICTQGKEPEYYTRTLNKILSLAESTDKIVIY